MTGKIFQLPGNPHREVEALMPWYVTGQLDGSDTARVEGHVQGCPECQAELDRERRLDREITRRPADVDAGWAMMRDRLDRDRPHRQAAIARPAARGTIFGITVPTRRTAWKWFGLGLGAQFATAALLAIVVLPDGDRADYRTLGTADAPAAGNLLVIFRPETSEQLFRQTLRANAARLVDGPTAANAYVLMVPAEQRDRLAARLRGQPQVVLAEPIDAGQRP